MNQQPQDISSNLEFEATGRQFGELKLVHSDNERPAGYYSIPAAVLNGDDGPTLLLTGGVHGDEYVGPATLFTLLDTINVSLLRGRLIVLPALNSPAVLASSRCSPIDDKNLNRAFSGSKSDSLTSTIADFVDSQILPIIDAAIDIHSGGRAHTYAPVAMVYLGARSADKLSLRMAELFGCDYVWAAEFDESRTLNAAALRQDKAMIAVELGGLLNSRMVNIGISGVHRILADLDMYEYEESLPGSLASTRISVAAAGCIDSVRRGLFVPAVSPGQRVSVNDNVGTLFSIEEPERESVAVITARSGVVLAVTNNGMVNRGDRLVVVAEV